MPGWYIHMDVTRKAIDSLAGNATAATIFGSNGPDAEAIKTIAHANPAYTALGAIGPDIFFLLPDFKPPVGSLLWKLAQFVDELYTFWDENFLGPYESAMGPIANNLDDELNALSGGLKEQLEGIFGTAFAFLRDEILKLIEKQYDFFGLLSSGVPAGFDEQTFFWSDMLHYRETYRFATVLWQRANDAAEVPDAATRARFQAFALGWMSHLATDVTGHAFVNQKVGGPYRLHWQRHHLVENHMDAQVYDSENGAQPIYQMLSNSALHLWLAFNPDGSSRANFFDAQPNPPYPDGDHSADITGRHAVWDFDSDMPENLAEFISDTLKKVYTPELIRDVTGMVACCPTIISTLDGRVPLETNGYAEPGDISGAYGWLYKYVKMTTTDYYKIRRPEPPEVFVIPSFPSPPGSGDSDPGPGATEDSSFWENALKFLLALLAWAAYLAEIAIWPAAVIAGIIAGTATYPLRQVIYEYMELPLYNLWLGVHTYMAMTGYVMPMPAEINPGLNTLGVSVADGWATTVVALGDPDGGLSALPLSSDPSGTAKAAYPRDVLIDPPGTFMAIGALIGVGSPAVGGELPSEFSRPWRFPQLDNEGDTVNTEHRGTIPGPFTAGMNATSLLGAQPGTNNARKQIEDSPSEEMTRRIVSVLFRTGENLGDPQDYATYVIAGLTRQNLDPSKIANFNLDSDRGYGYLCWDWLRDAKRPAMPSAFKGNGDPSKAGKKTDVSQHVYPAPAQPGYGWNPDDQVATGVPPLVSFDPNNPEAIVRIRYIGREGKFIP